MIERGDLEHLRRRHPQLVRQCGQVRRRQVAVRVLNAVQMLDQQVRATRLVTEQCTHIRERVGIDVATLWRGAERQTRGGFFPRHEA
jgi:hypothetical protein